MKASKQMTRRGFVQAGAAGAAVCAGVTAGAALADQAAPVWDVETDVVVVGSGYAGLSAAIEAAGAGLEVLALEKNVTPGGNSILCAGNLQLGGGTAMQIDNDLADTPERFYDDIYKYGSYRAVPELLRTFVDHSVECYDWLESLGVVFNDTVTQNEGMSVPCSHMPAESDLYPGKKGISYWVAMQKAAEGLGAQILLERKAGALILNDHGVCEGVEVDEGNGIIYRYRARYGVILASGGWKSNVAMRTTWDPRLDTDLSAGGLPYVETTGEMINHAIDAGAGVRDMSFVCELRFKWGTHLYQSWLPASIDVVPGGAGVNIKDYNQVMMVQNDGVRFVDEVAANTYPQEPFYEAFLNLPDRPRSVWAIADAAGCEALSWDVEQLANPDEGVAPCLAPEMVAIADSVDELAEKIGVDAATLAETIERYNAMAATGDEDFGKEAGYATIEQPPFYALKLQFFAHDQMGGLIANTRAQVVQRSSANSPEPLPLDEQAVIPHLYAAGECVGGYVGAERGHGKIGIYMVFGRIAGQQVAQETPLA